MLRIRFFRTGKKNQPFFRIVVTDRRHPPRGGRFLEILGFFNPLTKERKLKKERIKHWISVGAQPSDSVYNLLIEEKVLEGKKVPVHKKKKKEKKEKPKKEKPKEEKPKEEKVKEKEKPKEPKKEIKEEKPREEKVSEEKTKEPEKPVQEKEKTS